MYVPFQAFLEVKSYHIAYWAKIKIFIIRFLECDVFCALNDHVLTLCTVYER